MMAIIRWVVSVAIVLGASCVVVTRAQEGNIVLHTTNGHLTFTHPEIVSATRIRHVVQDSMGAIFAIEAARLQLRTGVALTVLEPINEVRKKLEISILGNESGGHYYQTYLTTCQYGAIHPDRRTVLLNRRHLGFGQTVDVEDWYPPNTATPHARLWVRLQQEPAIWAEFRTCEPRAFVDAALAGLASQGHQLPPGGIVAPLPSSVRGQ